MRFDVLERNLKQSVLRYIQENLLGKCSNHENETNLSELVRKLQQSEKSELPEFSEIEKRVLNVLFLKIFSENEGCLVVFDRLNESLNNMNSCLELLADYAAKFNEIFISEIMKKRFIDLASEYFYYSDRNSFTNPCVNDDVLQAGLQSLLQYLKEKLDEESTPFIHEIEYMNRMIEKVKQCIQTLKSSNAEQLLEIIFSHPDKLFPDFKSIIRNLFTRWSIIQSDLIHFVESEYMSLEIIINDDEEKRFEQQYGRTDNLDVWRKFYELYSREFNKDDTDQDNTEQDDEKPSLSTKLEFALELARRNIHE
jgi:hypothetical protein